jgi:magnesium-protoporphyrin O-methyltransferase
MDTEANTKITAMKSSWCTASSSAALCCLCCVVLLTPPTLSFAPVVVVTGRSVAAQASRQPSVLLKANLVQPDQDKTEVREYFNTEGFNRWNKIYSESDDVNTVQMDIRTGHDQTIGKIISWIRNDEDSIAGKTVCDCGCGVGSLAIPLAQMGAKVSASDISDAMAAEAARRAKELGIVENAKFFTADLESVTGRYDTVTCVDVAIHYTEPKLVEMITHLCSLAESRLIFSFAPKTWYYELLKKVGELFPGPSKTTRAYLHDEAVVRAALERAGFAVARDEMTGTNFYFSRLLEAKRRI